MRGSASGRGLLAGSIWMMLGFALKILLQALFFVVIARSLGPDEYGAFMAAAALSAVLAPFAGLGSGNLLVQYVSRDRREFPVRWGNALIVTATYSLGLLALLLLAAAVLLRGKGVALAMIAAIGVADFLFIRLLEAAGQAFQAVERVDRTAQLQVLPNIMKLLAALLLVFVLRTPSAWAWGMLYLASAAVTAIVGVWLVTHEIARPVFRWRAAFANAREGFHFSVSLAAQNVYNDVDKTMLGSLSTAGAVGIYAAAYRLIDVSFAPVRSVLFASYADFFKAGKDGMVGALRVARRIGPFVVGFGLVASIGAFVLAPVVPLILGAKYASAVLALRWLAPLPLLKAIHYVAADSLTGAGYQPTRSWVQIGVSVANVLLNLVLIPRYSWLGAAWASIASDALLAAGLCAAIWTIVSRGSAPRHDHVPATMPGVVEVESAT